MEGFDTAYLLAGLVFIAIFTLYMAVDSLFSRKEKLQQLEEKIAVGNTSYGQEELVGMEDEKTPTAAMLEGVLRGMGVKTDARAEEVRPLLQHAGMSTVNAPIYYLFFNYVIRWILVIFAGLFLFAALGQEEGGTLNYLMAVLLLFLGIMGPKTYVKNQEQKRKKILVRSFPDTLDLLVVCVESGLALDAALARVCRELGRAHPEMTKELNRTRLELALLNDRSVALQNLAERTDLVPFRSLVAALIQTEKFGTSLTDTLRVLSEDYRQTRLSLAEQKAGRLPVIMTIPLICLLLPALLIIILGPPFVRVHEMGGIFGGVDKQSQQETQKPSPQNQSRQ